MERNIRYQLLPNDETTVEPEAVEVVAVVPPPGYEESVTTSHDNPTLNDSGDMAAFAAAPPSYKIATELPTYDEAEKSKQEEAEAQPTRPVHATINVGRSITPSNNEEMCDTFTGITLGTDCIFLSTFIVSFLFNWIGFFISLCLSNTVAGRCGALSGLGLSIVKWAAILQHSEWMSDYVSDADNWIWWMLMFCGFVVFFRGCIQYFQIKYEWKKVTGQVLTLRWFN